MKIPFFIAFRYLFAKKTTQAINIIAGISLVGFTIGVFAMIVVLSTMNGFEKLVFGMYNDFTPSIRVSALKGKVIDEDKNLLTYFKTNFPDATVSATLEDNASCRYGQFQYICRIKGVEPQYIKQAHLENHTILGEIPQFNDRDSIFSMLGQGVDYKLATMVSDPNCVVEINAPRRGNFSINSLDAINTKYTKPAGVFAYDDAINNRYLLVSLKFAQDLFERNGQISSYELYLADDGLMDKSLAKIKTDLKGQYQVSSRYMLHESLYKMFKTEKWFTFAILSFVLLIVSFNLMGSLTLLVIEKKADILTMNSIGMQKSKIRNIFFVEGVLITTIGAIIGVALGVGFCMAQIHFGFIKIAGAIVESYPMHVNWVDVILSLLTAVAIGVLASIYPARKAGSFNV